MSMKDQGGQITRVLWLSRHAWTQSQLDALRHHLGVVELVQDPQPFSSVEEIVQRYRDGGFDDIVVVAPLSVIARLIDFGIKPLWAEMQQVQRDKGEVVVKGRGYRFERFRRIVGIELKFEEL